MYMYKEDLSLNNQQLSIWHKTNQIKSYIYYIYICIYINEDLALSDLQLLVCQRIKPNQRKLYLSLKRLNQAQIHTLPSQLEL